MQHVVLDVAASCVDVDVDVLAQALLAGRARAGLERDLAVSVTDTVQGSPHLFLPDGTDMFNPGITLRWHAEYGVGFPVVEHDDPSVYPDLIKRAAA